MALTCNTTTLYKNTWRSCNGLRRNRILRYFYLILRQGFGRFRLSCLNSSGVGNVERTDVAIRYTVPTPELSGLGK